MLIFFPGESRAFISGMERQMNVVVANEAWRKMQAAQYSCWESRGLGKEPLQKCKYGSSKVAEIVGVFGLVRRHLYLYLFVCHCHVKTCYSNLQ